MILCEFRQVLVEVEDDGDGDDQCDGEEIVAYELLDNVPVEPLDVPERVEKPEYAEEPELVPEPARRTALAMSHPNLRERPSWPLRCSRSVFLFSVKSFMMLA